MSETKPWSIDNRSNGVLRGVDPALRTKVVRLLEVMASIGLPMVCTDGNRTTERQRELYAQGRTKPGKRVTDADGVKVKSNHQGGRAADCTFLNAHGSAHYPNPETDKDGKIIGIWGEYGRRAKLLGLKWGGDWKKPDCPHVEL